jgi:hypothetical protein
MTTKPSRMVFVYAGSGRFWSAPKIRIWTIPINDCIAWPTNNFYSKRYVYLSNEGNWCFPKWVALDRHNQMPSEWEQFRTAELLFVKLPQSELDQMKLDR